MLEYTPISQKQITDFDQNGYLIVRDVLDDKTIRKLVQVSDRLINSNLQINRRTKQLDDSFRNTVTLDKEYLSLITHPIILPLVIQLLGSSLQLITSHLIYKHPNPTNTPETYRDPVWHRDYLQAMMAMGHYGIPRIELKCAYYFTDLSKPNTGVTMVSPGSNLLTQPLQIPEGEPDPPNAVAPLLNPGDCLIFENRTWHAGAVNLSKIVRKCIMIGYGYRWIRPMDFLRQEPGFIKKLSPLERFLVGEQYDDEQNFQPNGGINPLADWCKKHGLPIARHLGPENTVNNIY